MKIKKLIKSIFHPNKLAREIEQAIELKCFYLNVNFIEKKQQLDKEKDQALEIIDNDAVVNKQEVTEIYRNLLFKAKEKYNRSRSEYSKTLDELNNIKKRCILENSLIVDILTSESSSEKYLLILMKEYEIKQQFLETASLDLFNKLISLWLDYQHKYSDFVVQTNTNKRVMLEFIDQAVSNESTKVQENYLELVEYLREVFLLKKVQLNKLSVIQKEKVKQMQGLNFFINSKLLRYGGIFRGIKLLNDFAEALAFVNNFSINFGDLKLRPVSLLNIDFDSINDGVECLSIDLTIVQNDVLNKFIFNNQNKVKSLLWNNCNTIGSVLTETNLINDLSVLNQKQDSEVDSTNKASFNDSLVKLRLR